jgi:H+/Na+-translocating ferredoxin:NAD+ oxidoreductase subunit G
VTEPARPSILRGGLILAALAALCTTLVALTHRYTLPLIAANEQAFLEASLQPVLGGIEYEQSLEKSVLRIDPPHELPGDEPVTIYRIVADGKPAAALFVVSAPGGFVGPIQLLIGVRVNGQVTSVRVLQHRETPGLGDKIELAKSDWLLQFDGKSLSDPERNDWAIRRDGGHFDQLTGASITPRAVVKGIRDTLIYFEANRDAIFGAPETVTD